MRTPTATTHPASTRPAKPALKAPREHGGWVLIGVSVAVGAALAAPTPQPGVVALVSAAALSGFLAHEPLRAWLARGQQQALRPLLALGGAAALCGVGALALSGARALLWVAAIDAALLTYYALRLRRVARRASGGGKRVDRTTSGQAVAAVVLTSAAPALALTGAATAPWLPWTLWGACALYFCAGILDVHALLEARAVKGPLSAATRWRLVAPSLIAHGLLAAAFCAALAVAWRPDAWGWWVVAAAPVPACARAAWRAHTLSTEPPPMRRVGLQALAWSLWFGAGLCVGLRALLG